VAFEGAEAEEVPDAIAVEGHRGLPVEAFERLFLLEAGRLSRISRFFWSRRSTSSCSTSSRKSNSGSFAFQA
jgi:hypothetical protein